TTTVESNDSKHDTDLEEKTNIKTEEPKVENNTAAEIKNETEPTSKTNIETNTEPTVETNPLIEELNESLKQGLISKETYEKTKKILIG
ncbi:MAG: hypothetical protein KAS12_01985, partial [Candidatus Aenigmarchaeota archaeon]|nr:hypothetical protein [Candidatus Aenigmarchaeota archaeon]